MQVNSGIPERIKLYVWFNPFSAIVGMDGDASILSKGIPDMTLSYVLEDPKPNVPTQ